MIDLTPKQIGILQTVANGVQFKSIPSVLGISVTTAAVHLRRAKYKLGKQTTTAAVVEALRKGLIEWPPEKA